MTIARIRELLDHGAPWEACDAFRDLSSQAPKDPDLLYWGALAHARAGATHEAHALLDRAQPRAEAAGSNALLTEILSLRGRLLKDAVHRAPDSSGAAAQIERARAQYLAAYRVAQDPFPGINAATLSMLVGDREAARNLALEVIAGLAPVTALSAWELASLGEARLLLGNVDGAKQSYAEAKRACGGNVGTIASMRRQLALLSRALPACGEVLEALPSADVVAFAGHMVDAPNRRVARFPPELVPAVAAVIRGRLAAMNDPIVYSSAACGADLLFVEAALDLGAEVNLVLPFQRDDFVRTSVATGGSEWLPRFDAVLARAKRIVMASDEHYLGDDVLFDHAARFVEGLAKLRADQLQTMPSLLCVVDSGEGDFAPRIGGAQATLARWTLGEGAADVIDLRRLRSETAVGAEAPSEAAAAGPAAAAGLPHATAPVVAAGQRTLKTMLFADIAGYSRLDDAVIPQFQRQFLELAAGLIEAAGARPLEAKTWGDALYAVFGEAREAAEFALRFAERMRDTDWALAGMWDAGQIRVALHAGPVFRCFDPVMGRDSHFGSNVTRAARIEPITPPGVVYASEAFAATLASSGTLDYVVEYVGVLPLAKGYGESRVYRLERR